MIIHHGISGCVGISNNMRSVILGMFKIVCNKRDFAVADAVQGHGRGYVQSFVVAATAFTFWRHIDAFTSHILFVKKMNYLYSA